MQNAISFGNLQRTEKALRESQVHLRLLSHRLLEVQEAERRHLARELHDEFGQVLASVALHLYAAKGLAGEATLPQLDECAALLRHAQARHVWIELNQREDSLELVVRDDGVGFDLAPTQEQAIRRGSLGLLGMAERVQLLGGTLQVESNPGAGTRVRASFPLSED